MSKVRYRDSTVKNKMNLLDWFDIHNKEHLLAYQHLMKTGFWPECFLPIDIEIPVLAIVAIENKMAREWMKQKLSEK